jgi:hypothetical protein
MLLKIWISLNSGLVMMHTEMGDQEHNIDDDDEDLEDDFMPSDADEDDTDNIGDVSVEINVESLIAEIEEAHDSDAARKREVHRRLEEIREQREVSKEMEDTFAAYLDDED